jgi:hypothetical protein
MVEHQPEAVLLATPVREALAAALTEANKFYTMCRPDRNLNGYIQAVTTVMGETCNTTREGQRYLQPGQGETVQSVTQVDTAVTVDRERRVQHLQLGVIHPRDDESPRMPTPNEQHIVHLVLRYLKSALEAIECDLATIGGDQGTDLTAEQMKALGETELVYFLRTFFANKFNDDAKVATDRYIDKLGVHPAPGTSPGALWRGLAAALKEAASSLPDREALKLRDSISTLATSVGSDGTLVSNSEARVVQLETDLAKCRQDLEDETLARQQDKDEYVTIHEA